MGFTVHLSWLSALLCLLCMGGKVLCNCTDTNMQIEGGDYKLTKRLQTGSLLIYNCPEGYYPFPVLTRVCQSNGQWKPAPKRFSPQKCRLVECPDPNVLEYGNVSPHQEKYFVHNETAYECYSGYTMRGSSKRVCLPNGKWSGSTPICSRDSLDTCADPGVPAGASRSGDEFGIGSKVTYSCIGNGLFLVGSKERVCQENGQWTGSEPACYYKHTYDTPLEVSKVFGSAIKQTLTTMELTDQTSDGRKIRISRNSTLNIYIAVDISENIDENYIRNAKELVKRLISKISSFVVSPNYEIFFFSCDIIEVANILEFWDGRVTAGDVYRALNIFQKSAENSGSNLNRAFETILERMSFLKQRVGQEAFKKHRHVLIVFTDGGYIAGGTPLPTVEKIKKMVDMDSSGDNQPREEYLDIYIFGYGEVLYDDYLQPLTAGTGGQHYFRMKDIGNLHETLDEIIDESDLGGLCGLHTEYETGNKRTMYPWVAFIHIQNEGVPRKCLGSLVTPQFVLTAAHCFMFGNIPEHVTVEIDDGQGKVKRVRNFMIHPNFNVLAKLNVGVREFYDYDVALIQLVNDVKISKAVRPICIPCTKETSHALKLVSDSTCRQQEEILLKNQLEKLTFLTRSRNLVDEKDVHAKLGDNRDECISHALQAPGITTTNAKDAVTDNFLCTGGLFPYRDQLACKGDGGGAVFKNYEHRTIQVALVSWGTSQKCRASGVVDSDATSRDFHINLFRVVPFLKSILGNDNDDYMPLQFLED